MARPTGHPNRPTEPAPSPKPVTEARVALLIPTHELPPLSYRIPEHLRDDVHPGSVVVAPLSGYSRLGVVVGVEDEGEIRDLEEVRDVFENLALEEGAVEVCRWVCEVSAVPLGKVLRAALPPGLEVGSYRVLHPGPEWPWGRGVVVTRNTLRRTLGLEGLKAAEDDARVELYPHAPAPASEEWAVLVPGRTLDFGRAHAQRGLFEALKAGGAGGMRSADGLKSAGANRATLLKLEGRGLVRLVKRPAAAATQTAAGDGFMREAFPLPPELDGAMERGGTFVWRVPTVEQAEVAAAFARRVVAGGEQALVLAPEIEAVERIRDVLLHCLPAGSRVAVYHSGLGRGRSAVHSAARTGAVDVIVGTRAAALLPLPNLGGICVTDEPNEAYRAEPGYEGLPLHARDIARRLGEVRGASVLLVSATPSLRLYGAGVEELPARSAAFWPAVRLVDMRGTGAVLSATLLDACRSAVEGGGRVGVLVNRLGGAVSVVCNRCGAARVCPACDLPLALHGAGRSTRLICTRCGHREKAGGDCPECGSSRLSPSGLAAEGVRAALREALDTRVGLHTAGERVDPDAPVVVGTARRIHDEEWDVVCVPDADSLILGATMGGVERGFRTLYRAAEAARTRLVVQTRVPEHYALQAALRGDYRSFAAAELPRLRALGYPPYAHLAEVVLEGPESVVRNAVESRLRPKLSTAVGMSAVVPVGGTGKRGVWRVLLRSAQRREVARSATQAVRLGGRRAGGLKVTVDVDPEEV